MNAHNDLRSGATILFDNSMRISFVYSDSADIKSDGRVQRLDCLGIQ
jgi:hypothetical protein